MSFSQFSFSMQGLRSPQSTGHNMANQLLSYSSPRAPPLFGKEAILLKVNVVGDILPGFDQSFFNRKKTDCFPPKHFCKHILWIEEFSAAGQSKFLNTRFTCQQKPYRTRFDFDLPNNTHLKLIIKLKTQN